MTEKLMFDPAATDPETGWDVIAGATAAAVVKEKLKFAPRWRELALCAEIWDEKNVTVTASLSANRTGGVRVYVFWSVVVTLGLIGPDFALVIENQVPATLTASLNVMVTGSVGATSVAL